MAEFVPGRYVMADTDNEGMRDVTGLTSQVKLMRVSMEEVLHKRVGLIVVVVDDDQRKSAVGHIQSALDNRLDGSSS